VEKVIKIIQLQQVGIAEKQIEKAAAVLSKGFQHTDFPGNEMADSLAITKHLHFPS